MWCWTIYAAAVRPGSSIISHRRSLTGQINQVLLLDHGPRARAYCEAKKHMCFGHARVDNWPRAAASGEAGSEGAKLLNCTLRLEKHNAVHFAGQGDTLLFSLTTGLFQLKMLCFGAVLRCAP